MTTVMKSAAVLCNLQIGMHGFFPYDAHKSTEKGDMFIHMTTEQENIDMQMIRFRRTAEISCPN